MTEASDPSGAVKFDADAVSPFDSARGSLLGFMSPPRRLMEKLGRPSPDWLAGRLCRPSAKREAARERRDAVVSSLGVITGELAPGVTAGDTAAESVNTL